MCSVVHVLKMKPTAYTFQSVLSISIWFALNWNFRSVVHRRGDHKTTCSHLASAHNDKQQISQELELKWLRRVHRVSSALCIFFYRFCSWGKVICSFANHQMQIVCIHFDWLCCICLGNIIMQMKWTKFRWIAKPWAKSAFSSGDEIFAWNHANRERAHITKSMKKKPKEREREMLYEERELVAQTNRRKK